MKYYLVVYEEAWSYEATALKSDADFDVPSGSSGSFWNVTEKRNFSRLRSMAIKAENKIDAFNKAKSKFTANENIIHIESLSDQHFVQRI